MFKTRHGSNGKKRPSTIGRSVMLVIIASFLFFIVFKYLKNTNNSFPKSNDEYIYNIDVNGTEFVEPSQRFYLPSSTTNQIVHHKFYSLSYNEKYEQAEWVAYVLTKESLKIPNVERAKRFVTDVKVKSRSAIYYDYKGSGYSRGHLAPAGDMAFSKEAMRESFFMSNMSPQKRAFNGGIWNELENNVRNWAYKNNKLFIVTGPILDSSINQFIGKNKVGVPKYFYKIMLDIDDPDRKAIGFVIPNEKSIKPLKEYVVTIDKIEELTGIDFFKDLISEEEQDRLESNSDISKWKVSSKLFKKRIEVWNNN